MIDRLKALAEKHGGKPLSLKDTSGVFVFNSEEDASFFHQQAEEVVNPGAEIQRCCLASLEKEFLDEGSVRVPLIDPGKYPPIPGMEGPFRYRSGRVLYYDPKKGRYYDRRSDMYLSRDTDPMQEDIKPKMNVRTTVSVVTQRGKGVTDVVDHNFANYGLARDFVIKKMKDKSVTLVHILQGTGGGDTVVRVKRVGTSDKWVHAEVGSGAKQVPAVARHGDSGSHGGSLSAITSRTYVNGLLVVTVGARYSCPIHGSGTVVGGSSKLFAEGMAVARIGDPISCGAVVSSGSPNTFDGG